MSRLEQQLRAALEENRRLEIALGHMRHSVGNQLALLSGMLARQARTEGEARSRLALENALSRIGAIAETMRSERLGLESDRVGAQELVGRVVAQLAEFAAAQEVSIELQVEDFELDGDQAASFMLILNELIVNALKHAFPGNMTGIIRVRFSFEQTEAAASLTLAVEDDGVGLPAGSATQGFGLRIVASAAQKLGAVVVGESLSADPLRPGRRTTVVQSRA